MGGALALALLAPMALGWAATPAADGTIGACYKKSSGSLRVIDHPHQSCGKDETLLTWDSRGVPGDPGPVGPQGPGGPAGPPGPAGVPQLWSASGAREELPPDEIAVAELRLPPGTYLAESTVDIVHAQAPPMDYACWLMQPLQVVDFTTGTTAERYGWSSDRQVLRAVVALPSGGTLLVRCRGEERPDSLAEALLTAVAVTPGG